MTTVKTNGLSSPLSAALFFSKPPSLSLFLFFSSQPHATVAATSDRASTTEVSSRADRLAAATSSPRRPARRGCSGEAGRCIHPNSIASVHLDISSPNSIASVHLDFSRVFLSHSRRLCPLPLRRHPPPKTSSDLGFVATSDFAFVAISDFEFQTTDTSSSSSTRAIFVFAISAEVDLRFRLADRSSPSLST